MEHINGQSLDELIRTDSMRQAGQRMSVTRKLELIDQLCDGLGCAHGHSLVHRDIKPKNLMVDERWKLTILDFGIVKLVDSSRSLSKGMGTPSYMSPEQINETEVDSRSDIFSVGAVCYELFASQRAFPGDKPWIAVINKHPIPLTEACPGLDPDVVRIVERCLQKEPEQRYPDLAKMRSDIAAVLRRYAKEVVATARNRFDAGEHLEAIQLLEQFEPTDHLIDATLADLRQRRDDAIRLERVLGEALSKAHRRWVKGDLDGVLEGLDEAIGLKDDLLDLLPPDILDVLADTYGLRGTARQDKGDLDGALEDFDEAIRLNPDRARHHCFRGGAREAKGDLDGALEDIEEALRLNPDLADTYRFRGRVRQDKGDLDGALEDFDEAIRLNPDHARAYMDRGKTRKAKGDIHGAIKDLEEALRPRPPRGL